MIRREREYGHLDPIVITPKWKQWVEKIKHRSQEVVDSPVVTPRAVRNFYELAAHMLIQRTEGRGLTKAEQGLYLKLTFCAQNAGHFPTIGALERHADEVLEESERALFEIHRIWDQ